MAHAWAAKNVGGASGFTAPMQEDEDNDEGDDSSESGESEGGKEAMDEDKSSVASSDR
jgi:hypothetical protein